MKSYIRSIVTVAAVLLLAASCGVKQNIREHMLFQSGVTDSIPYRIPAIAAMHNGDILALTDYRLCGNDIGYGRVDIHGRVSHNGGKSWGEEFVLIDVSGVSKA